MNYVKFEADIAVEQAWLEKDPTTSLVGAAVFVPEGAELSEAAIETIRHFRYYYNAKDGFVLFSDGVIETANVGRIEEMIGQANGEADAVTRNMPDFTLYDMDDGCGILHMTNAEMFAFRPYKLQNRSLALALEARQECLEACEKCEVVAVVYCNAEDYK